MMKKTHHFKPNETYKHFFAKILLADWVGGTIEEPFFIDDSYLFIPDVTVKENNVLTSVYEVVCTHSFTGKKLGLIQEWCYRNATDLTVFEISAEYIMTQKEKPDIIRPMECYIVEF